MKEIPEGHTAELSILVTESMTVDFEELGAGHPVYATYWIAKHFEEAGRKLLLPFLEEGDGGIGTNVSVEHTASALPGMRVSVMAVAVKTEGRRLYADLRAISELGDVVATGQTVQYITQATKLEHGFDTLRQRWNEYQQEEKHHA
ncbi:thioesterase [Deinococcus detaillensis]|uniref:Thioesterase n=1 Tax=Deinococcus detaillensis TaxID=2592048 RepID=A0A553V547_9DEIO|nr:thioesterase family protein [Deinococcus detaillensis]TSA87603.1 thioesterase [Deinococcus detaillensis]